MSVSVCVFSAARYISTRLCFLLAFAFVSVVFDCLHLLCYIFISTQTGCKNVLEIRFCVLEVLEFWGSNKVGSPMVSIEKKLNIYILLQTFPCQLPM